LSTTYIPTALRTLVKSRAYDCCEYCRVGENTGVVLFSCDHIISEKHGGKTVEENLAYACYWCNTYKGSDVGSVDLESNREFIRLFDPRQDLWDDYFHIENAILQPKTQIAKVTIKILRLNDEEKIKERAALTQLDQYPCYQG
jgi:hypothetical protein